MALLASLNTRIGVTLEYPSGIAGIMVPLPLIVEKIGWLPYILRPNILRRAANPATGEVCRARVVRNRNNYGRLQREMQ
jgi:hypothetical protein